MTPLRALAFAAAAVLASCAAPPPPRSDPAKAAGPAQAEYWVEPRLLRADLPAYPPQEAAAHVTAFVDIDGVIKGNGSLEEINYRTASPDAIVFASALEAMRPRWKFYPVLGEDCLPMNEIVTVHVSFEFEGDAPKVRMSAPQPRNALAKAQPFKLDILGMEAMSFPKSMHDKREAAFVYARQEIDAAGQVSAVSTKAYPIAAGTGHDVEDFAAEARRGLSLWKFDAVEAGAPPRFACQALAFLEQ